MPDTCQHGLPAADCLICRTLPATAGGGADPIRSPGAGSGSRRDRPPAQAPGPRHGSLALHTAGVVAGIAVIGVIAWVVAGAVFAILHIIELLVVAGVAGWAGYRVGRFRGNRHPR